METYILIAVILAVVGLAAWYVIKAKKSGRKCIGCPDGCCTSSPKESQAPSSCGGNCSCCCGCSPVQKDAE
ncbi:MAG: FeoB-associated Cys-rich membrane protein [Clostridia bacterium]|nr:FeoB-associated Cys-rich membrane protein [Clostridia bacterium]